MKEFSQTKQLYREIINSIRFKRTEQQQSRPNEKAEIIY